jgi:hypothetical protein
LNDAPIDLEVEPTEAEPFYRLKHIFKAKMLFIYGDKEALASKASLCITLHRVASPFQEIEAP